MSRLAHQLAVESAYVTADVIEVTEFPEQAERYRVTSVPKMVLDEQTELLGSQSATNLLEAIGLGSRPRDEV